MLSDGTSVIYRTVGSVDDLHVIYIANESASDILKVLRSSSTDWIQTERCFSLYSELYEVDTMPAKEKVEADFSEMICSLYQIGIIEKTI